MKITWKLWKLQKCTEGRRDKYCLSGENYMKAIKKNFFFTIFVAFWQCWKFCFFFFFQFLMWFILQFFKSVLLPLIGNAHARYDENKSPKKTEMNIKIRWTASKVDLATKNHTVVGNLSSMAAWMILNNRTLSG